MGAMSDRINAYTRHQSASLTQTSWPLEHPRPREAFEAVIRDALLAESMTPVEAIRVAPMHRRTFRCIGGWIGPTKTSVISLDRGGGAFEIWRERGRAD
jgi:hypothetical protein